MPNYRNSQGTGTVETDILKVGDVEFKQAETQADSEAEDVEGLVEDFNALLSKLKAAGLMK